MRRATLLALAVGMALSSPFLRAAPEPMATAGRELVKKYADAIIGVELVVTLKIKVGDREAPPREQRVEVNGTVISADGLTVTSLAEVDPQTTFEAMRAMQPGGRGPELVGADFKEVKLRLADGTEVPAKFVLKDSDLDLAFMAPDLSAGGTKRDFAHISLDQAVQGQVLGNYFFVARASKVLQRVPLVRSTEITAIVEKPRKFYLCADYVLGTPMLDADGKILGITLQHFANGRRTGFIVLPAEDIADMAKQAKAAQEADAKKAAEAPAATEAKTPAAPDAAPAGEKK